MPDRQGHIELPATYIGAQPGKASTGTTSPHYPNSGNDQARLAVEREAQRVPAELARMAAEAEANARQQARLAALAEAQRLADEQARLAAQAAAQHIATEQARLAELAETQRQAELLRLETKQHTSQSSILMSSIEQIVRNEPIAEVKAPLPSKALTGKNQCS